MERIKAAIEKAKKSSDDVNKIKKLNRLKDKSQYNIEKAGVDLSSLHYQQTKIIKVNPDHLNEKRIISYSKSNQYSTYFDLLRTQVLHAMKENNWKTLAITSPTPEAGKTVVSINLAMSIAHQTETTAMLIDFDLRRPKVEDYMGLDVDVSLSDYFEGQAEIQDVMINPGIPRFVVLPVSKPVDNASELLSSNKVSSMITEFKERYEERVVIFDLPPILNTDDTIAILPKIDCVLMVIANGMSTKKEILESVQQLGTANLLGVVLNKTDENTKRYYYGKGTKDTA